MSTTEVPEIDEIRQILERNFPYYNLLSDRDKKKFAERTQYFISIKEFLPRWNLDLTTSLNEIKTLISASAIQITFGLDEYSLEHFSKIFIYPSAYFNSHSHLYYKGETNIIGAIVFSWKDFKEGYRDAETKTNLGIHEMAHALLLSRSTKETSDAFFAKYFDKWWAVSQGEYLKMHHHETSFFRDYGGTNPQEFFAVCVEHFFKAAGEFKEKHPEIYRQTCILLNQDPTADFKAITQTRSILLNNDVFEVTPGILEFRTSGRTWKRAVESVIGVAFCISLFYAGWSADALIFPVIAIIVILLAYVSEYTEFYLYDNAFAVGYQRLKWDAKESIVFSPEQMISVAFKVNDKESPVFALIYVNDAEIEEDTWAYQHLNASDKAGFEASMKEFCLKKKIALLKTLPD